MANGNNTVLRTFSRAGERVATPMRLYSVSSDLSLQISQSQTKSGIRYRPIRLQERFLLFTALYPASDPRTFERAMDAIRDHWAYVLDDGGNGDVMVLDYKGRGDQPAWKGMIQGYSRTYAWNDVLWRRDFQMRLVTQLEPGSSLDDGQVAPFIPHAGDVTDWGISWYTSDKLRSMSAALKRGAPGNRYKKWHPVSTSVQEHARHGRLNDWGSF